MRPDYSPFSRPLSDVQVADLAVLRGVHEGWYVEYKQEVPKAPSIAKSVSAFANTYGGFVFYGVGERSNGDNVAETFPGIPLENVESMRERIRQAICAHSAPEPHFEIRVWSGPSEEIGLAADRAIICVWVPRSARAPHVHKSGVIFRRVADASEPTAESDRHALGELFKRSSDLLSTYRAWYHEDPDFSEGEKTHPYLRLLLTFDPWREKLPWLGLNTPELRRLFATENGAATLPFDSIYSTREGAIARQTGGNGLDTLTITWALRRDLTSEILVPIPMISVNVEEASRVRPLAGYEHEDRFIDVLRRYRSPTLKVLDLNQLYPILIGVFETLARIGRAAEWTGSIWATFKLLNASRVCPFLDVARVIDRYEEHGIPVALGMMTTLTDHSHPDSFLEFAPNDELNESLVPETHAAILMLHLARSLGIPVWEDLSEADTDLFVELRQAGARSMKAQEIRSRRAG